MFLLPSSGDAFDLSVFKQAALKHASDVHTGHGSELPGDVMHELAQLLKPSWDGNLHADAGESHGSATLHGPTVTDDLGAALKASGGTAPKGAGKGHGGDTTGGGGNTGGGSTGGTTTPPGDTSSPPPAYVITDLSSGYSWGHGPITVKYAFLDSLPTK